MVYLCGKLVKQNSKVAKNIRWLAVLWFCDFKKDLTIFKGKKE
jgi:hypothetical protein